MSKPYPNVYNLGEANNLALAEIEMRSEQARSGDVTGVRVGVPEIDSFVNPMQGGQVVSVMGRPGNFKSGLMRHMFNDTVARIMDTSLNKCAIHVTWEESVEECAMYLLAQLTGLSMRDMLRGNLSVTEIAGSRLASLDLIGMPIFIIGNSTSRPKHGRRERNLLTRQLVEDCIGHIMNGTEYMSFQKHWEPAIVTFDYLQLIPQVGNNRREWLISCMKWAKDMSFITGAPSVIGVQARREVDDRANKMPTSRDGEETSTIEQASDAMFGCTIPNTYIELQGEEIDWLKGYDPLTVTPNLFFLSLLKQKKNAAGKSWALTIDYQTGKLTALPRR